MPKFEITAPDGKRYEITAPEGATAEQALEHFKSQYTAPSSTPNVPAAPKPAPSVYEQQAQKQSGIENYIAGLGGNLYGLYLGAKQRLGKAKPEEVEQYKQAMAGLRSTKAGTAGDISAAIPLGLALSRIPGANTYAGSILAGGGLGALQPTSEKESVADNAILGGIGGAAGKYLGDKLTTFLRGRGTPANSLADDQLALQKVETQIGLGADSERVLKRAQEMGFKATPGEASGSKTLKKFEAALASNPFTAGAFDDIKTHNAATLNKIAAKAIGENADSVSSTVLEQAKDRISNVYKMVADKNPRPIDPADFNQKMAGLMDEFEGLVPESFASNPIVKRFLDFGANGQATGEQLQNIASKLGNLAAKEMTTANGDRYAGMAAFRLKDMADDYLRNGLDDQTRAVFDQARGQYRNMMLLTQRSGVINPASGDVSGIKLANLLAGKDKAGYTFNKNQSDFYNAARFSDAFRPIVGDSGTATRSMQNLSLENLAKLPFGLVARLYASQPMNNMAAGYGHLASSGVAPGLGNMIGPALQQSSPLLGAQGLLQLNKDY